MVKDTLPNAKLLYGQKTLLLTSCNFVIWRSHVAEEDNETGCHVSAIRSRITYYGKHVI